MFHRSLFVATLLLVACSADPSTAPQSRLVEDTVNCVDNVFCIQGSHWDPSTCRCERAVASDDGGTSADADATDGPSLHCVEKALCILGSHWDPSTCRCARAVASDGGGTSADADTTDGQTGTDDAGTDGSGSGDSALCGATGGAYGYHCGCVYGTCSSPIANGGICPKLCIPACTCPDGTLWDDQNGGGCIVAGNCGGPIACPDGQTSCDGVSCTDLSSDPANCGACGTQCPDNQTCSGSECVSADAQLCADSGGVVGDHCGCAYGTCSSPTPGGGICPNDCLPACDCPDGSLWDDQLGQGCIPSYDCFF